MEQQLMISKQTLIGGTAAALVLACSISTASAEPRHGMGGSVGGNQSVRANVGANGASGTAQLSEGPRTTGRVRSSATMNGSRDLANSTRFHRRADIRGEREFGTTYGNRNYNGRSARVGRDRDVYAGQYARSGYVGGYDRDWQYGGASYATVSGGFGYSPDYAYVGYGGPYYDYVPGYASAGYYDYAPGFSIGVGVAPTYGGCTCAR
jgi:hypothetical protein